MTPEIARDRENLLVQLQPWPGSQMARESMVPAPQGQGIGFVLGYLGDMQLRFVFDSPGSGEPIAVRPEDVARLELTAARALALAASNVKRRGGAPQIVSLGDGVYALRGADRDYSPAYLLDRAFWRGQLEKFPQGLFAALPRRGVLMFAPAGDPRVQAELVSQAGRILADASTARISSNLYHFDATGWHVHSELPVAQPVGRPRAAAPDTSEDEGPESAAGQDHVDLDKAAHGQKMLVYSIIGSFVVNAVGRTDGVHPLIGLALLVVLAIYSLLGVVRLSSGLGKSTGASIAFMVASFVPLVNLVTWIALSVQATRKLRAAGWEVGLLGVRG